MICWRAATVAVSMFLALPAVAAPRVHSEIFRTVRSFEVTQDGAQLTPDATLELLDVPVTDRDRKRLWSHVPESQVVKTHHVRQMSIAGIWKDRAIANATTATRIYYQGIGGLDYSGMTHIASDRLQLRRIGGRWLVVAIARRVRNVGSTAAWHRRERQREAALAR